MVLVLILGWLLRGPALIMHSDKWSSNNGASVARAVRMDPSINDTY